jgi:hypothetical protein
MLPAISHCHNTIHLLLDMFLLSDAVILRLQLVFLASLMNSVKFEVRIFLGPFRWS